MATRASRKNRNYLYTKDSDLYSQRMLYTCNGITWEGTPCCYCGDPATEDEHVFPLAALNKLIAAAFPKLPPDLMRIVPACRECNRLAGGHVFQSFEEKRLYVKAQLVQRYDNVLRMPHWDTEELSALHGRMHTWIANGAGIREMLLERLRF